MLGDGNDSPAWSRKREGYAGAPADLRDRRGRDDGGDRLRAPYAELHVHSNFSFLDGAIHPEALVEEAARLELDALVLTDHDGMYGAVRFNDAARELGVRVGFGAELSLDLPAPQAGEPDPAGSHLLVIARQQEGYHRLCRVISHAQLAGGEKGRPVYDLEEVVDELAGHVVGAHRLPQGRRSAARSPSAGPAAARAELARLVDWFGPLARRRRADRPPAAPRRRRQRPPRRAGPRAAAADGRVEQRPLRHARTTPSSRTRSPRSGPAGRPRTSKAGGRRRGRRSCGPGWSSGAAFERRYPGAVGAGRRARASRWRST